MSAPVVKALDEIRTHLKTGFQAVYDADLKWYFDSIPHDKLMACLRMRVSTTGAAVLLNLSGDKVG